MIKKLNVTENTVLTRIYVAVKGFLGVEELWFGNSKKPGSSDTYEKQIT